MRVVPQLQDPCADSLLSASRDILAAIAL